MTNASGDVTDVNTRVIKVVREQVPTVPSDVAHTTNLGQFGLNSMKAVEVLFGLEDEFDLVIDENELEDDTFDTIEKISDFVSNKVGTDG